MGNHRGLIGWQNALLLLLLLLARDGYTHIC
jgi:hypothetical protein